MKYIPYVIFGLLATVYVRYVIRKALNDPPEEFRVYDGPASAEADGVEESFMDTNGEEWRWESF